MVKINQFSSNQVQENKELNSRHRPALDCVAFDLFRFVQMLFTTGRNIMNEASPKKYENTSQYTNTDVLP